MPCISGNLPCKLGHSKCFPLTKLFVYDLDENGQIKYCRDGGHLVHCSNINCTNTYKCPNSYCIPFRHVCNGMWGCSNGEDDANYVNYKCQGMLKCSTRLTQHEICLHPSEVCDGTPHCIHGEDEFLCDQQNGCVQIPAPALACL